MNLELCLGGKIVNRVYAGQQYAVEVTFQEEEEVPAPPPQSEEEEDNSPPQSEEEEDNSPPQSEEEEDNRVPPEEEDNRVHLGLLGRILMNIKNLLFGGGGRNP